MLGYSHADRVTDPALLKPERIQQVICEGKDIFGMLPEAYRARSVSPYRPVMLLTYTSCSSGKILSRSWIQMREYLVLCSDYTFV